MALSETVESITLTTREVAIGSLQQLLGDRLSTTASIRERHGKDASYHPCVPPDAVAFAQSTEEVSEMVKLCARRRVPIIPYGNGTSLEGHVAALRAGHVFLCQKSFPIGTRNVVMSKTVKWMR